MRDVRSIRLVSVSAAVVLAVAVLSGCTTPPPDTDVAAPAISAEDTCAHMTDVATILFNAKVSFSEGRSIRQELDGAARLASRVLARVQAEEGTELAAAVSALQRWPRA